MTRLTAKQKQRLYNLLTQGRRGIEIAKRLNLDPKVIYYHQKKFLGKDVKSYVKAIGTDKPDAKKQISVALIIIGEQITAIGRAMRGDYSV